MLRDRRKVVELDLGRNVSGDWFDCDGYCGGADNFVDEAGKKEI